MDGKRKKFFAIVLITIFFLSFSQVHASDDKIIDTFIDEQLSDLDIEPIEELLESLNKDVYEYIPELTINNLFDFIKSGDFNYSLSSLLNGIMRYFFKEVLANSQILGQLIILSVMLALLQNVQSVFERDNVSKLAYGTCYLILVGIIINSFTIALNLGRKTIDLMIDFLHSILPILISLLIASGGYTSAAILHPFILMTVSSIGTLIRDIVLPLVFLSAALQIVNNITDTLKVTRMSAFLKEVCVGLLGVFLSIFVGAVIIQGAGAAVADGISIRTVKFATKNFLPIVGGIFVDALDTVVGCSILLKSALGLFGTIIIFIICIFPILKIISLIFIFKVASAIVEPLGENKVVTCLNDMGNSLVLILVCVASVVMMLFIVITIIVGAGNMIIMMR